MSTLSRPDIVYPLAQVKEAMENYIGQLPAKISLTDNAPAILRHEIAIEPINILYWLHNQKTDIKMYWSDREAAHEMGSTGIADRIKGDGAVDHETVFAYLRDRLSADAPRMRYYGGMSFDPSCQDSEWKEFGSYQFIVPRFEIVRTNGQTMFAFNIAADKITNEYIEDIVFQLNQLDFSLDTAYRTPPKVLKRTDFPDRQKWNGLFSDISEDISRKKYEKIVLARRSIFDFDVAIRSCALIKHLKDITPNCFHFCFQLSEDTAFLGATPERLYRRDKRNIYSEAIAGTRPRGNTDDHDKELEAQLLNSIKDAHEHKYVADTIRAQFELFCRQFRSDKIFTLRKLRGSQHLQTQFSGELMDDVHDDEIMRAFHPTPAVGGTPTGIATEVIREKEPFGRGWYAGPVGYVGPDTAEFAVAIRSGLIHGNQLSLYAGAGIVSGSTSDAEWEEIENKISNFINVFNKQT